jgi:hypothetical protein
MEALGAAASAIAVTSVSVKIVGHCTQYAKDVKSAGGEVFPVEQAILSLKTAAEAVQLLVNNLNGARLEHSQKLSPCSSIASFHIEKQDCTLKPGARQ